MSNVTFFDSPKFGNLRVIELDGQLWFVAGDISAALDLGNPRSSIALLEEDERSVHTMDTPGGKQEVSIISEPGLYSLVLRSRKPEARAFKRWITHEVIPSIRRHGGYLAPDKLEEALLNPDTIIQLATNLKAEQEKRQALEKKIADDRPEVIFADSVAGSKESILIGNLAKMLKQNGIEMGQNRLFGWLREHGYLMSKGESWNLPTQRSMELGLFEIKEHTVNSADGNILLRRTTKVTGKGQQYFINKFLDERVIEEALGGAA